MKRLCVLLGTLLFALASFGAEVSFRRPAVHSAIREVCKKTGSGNTAWR